jgi:hypothetical protein
MTSDTDSHNLMTQGLRRSLIKQGKNQNPLLYTLDITPTALKPEALSDEESDEHVAALTPYIDEPRWKNLPLTQRAICLHAQGDGNCAFNAFVLGLKHLVEQDKFHFNTLPAPLFAELQNALAHQAKLLHELGHPLTPQTLQHYVLRAKTHAQLLELQKALAPALRTIALSHYEKEAPARLKAASAAIAKDIHETIASVPVTDGSNHQFAGSELLLPLARACNIHLQCFSPSGTLCNDSYGSADTTIDIAHYMQHLQKDEPTITLLHSGAHWDTFIPETECAIWDTLEHNAYQAARVDDVLAKKVNQRVDTLLDALDKLHDENTLANPVTDPLIQHLWRTYNVTLAIPANYADTRTLLTQYIVEQETACSEIILQQFNSEKNALDTLSEIEIQQRITTALEFVKPRFAFATVNANELLALDRNTLFAASVKDNTTKQHPSNAAPIATRIPAC